MLVFDSTNAGLFNHFIQMRLNEQECVVGERCILVPYRECHVQKYHDWMQNGELLEATSSERLTLAEEFEMRRSWQTDPDKLTFIILDVETYDKAQNEVEAMAGDINGFVIESDYEENRNRQKQITKCLELSVMIAEKAFRHRGLATEAVALMILYANAKLSMRNFVAKIDAANQASMLLFEKLHFHRLKFDETFQCFTMRFDFANCFQRLTEKFSLKVEPHITTMAFLFTNILNDCNDALLDARTINAAKLSSDAKVGTSDLPNAQNNPSISSIVKLGSDVATNVVTHDKDGASKDVPSSATIQMSKRERRRQEKRNKWQANRLELRRQAKKRRQERIREAIDAGEVVVVKQRLEHRRMCDSCCKIHVVVDMAFEHLMNDNLIRKTLSQLAFCYAANRKATNPLQFFITSLTGKTRTMFESREGNLRWDVNLMAEPLEELWPKTKIVYLTADSENVLESLDENMVYVIGGLIDHNAHKGICLKSAIANGFSHARLPIENFVKLQTRKVLTINHVFEILLHFSATGNWEEAFFSVIPTRKGVEQLNNELSHNVKENIVCNSDDNR